MAQPQPQFLAHLQYACTSFVTQNIDTGIIQFMLHKSFVQSNLPRIQTVPVGSSRPTHAVSKQVKLPAASTSNHYDPTSWGGNYSSNQRAESASTVATRMTGVARRKQKSLRNYDVRFRELMNFLSPKNALEGPVYRQPKIARNVIMFGVSQTSV